MAVLQNKYALLIAGLFLLFGAGYSYYTPLWVPPDEERHLAYCEYIAQNNRLPYLNANDTGFHIAQAVHPPLYYLVGSLFCRADTKLILQQVSINEGPGYRIITPPQQGQYPAYAEKERTAYLLRMLSLFFSSVTVYLTFLIALNIFPGDTVLAAISALLVATNPQFLHISASVSNEPLSTAFATLYLFLMINYLKAPFKLTGQLFAGTVLGCCLLTKLSAVLYLPVTLCITMWNNAHDRKNKARSLLVIMGVAFTVSGWWYLRNLIVYNDPIFTRALETIQPWSLRQEALSLSYAVRFIERTFISFFGFFGSLQIPIAPMHLIFYGALIILGTAGLCRLAVSGALLPFQLQALAVLALAAGAGAAFYLQMNVRYPMFMGRYLFVVIAPIAILTVTGLKMIVPVRLRNYVLLLTGCLLLLVNLDVLFRVLKPAYEETRLEVGASQPLFCCPTPELTKNTTVGQIFVSPKNNLCAVRVLFSNEAKPACGELRFTLKEADSPHKVLRQITVPVEKIEGLKKYYFIFPPLRNSQGRRYQFSFNIQSKDPHSGISLWYENKDCYDDGTLLINGIPLEGSLYFTVYHFTGRHPATEWQGKKETVINQGWYTNFRELQRYGELPADFRVKTTTHEKMLQLEKALENRKSVTTVQ